MYSLSFTGFFFLTIDIWSPPGIEPGIWVFVCRLVVVAQWQSACALSKWSCLGSIPGGNQIFLILYCFKKACERERIHLRSKMFVSCVCVCVHACVYVCAQYIWVLIVIVLFRMWWQMWKYLLPYSVLLPTTLIILEKIISFSSVNGKTLIKARPVLSCV